MEVANVIILSVMAFISANIDGMFIAIAFLTDPTYNSKNVLLGQVIGFWVLTIASLVLAQSLYIIPRGSASWFGAVPIIFGCIKLINYTKRDGFGVVRARSGISQIQVVSTLTITTGVDDVVAYSPIFATRKPHEITVLFIMFVLMTVAWWMMAQWLTERPATRNLVSKGGHILAPLLMIAIGIIIISDN